MLSQAFEAKFVTYLCVASLSVLLWDILDNVRNDYRLLFRYRLGLPTIVYFSSRVSVLGYVLVASIYSTIPSIPCTALEAIFIAFLIAGLASTPFLAYLRVCAVWHRSRLIITFFGVSWLSVAASGFTLINSIKEAKEGGNCTYIITGQLILAPPITNLFNHTAIFLAITYGLRKHNLGRNLNFRDCIRFMVGKGLPTFSMTLLHDSQVSYMIIIVVGATALVWCYVWTTSSPFRLALAPPFIILENIMICRVYRNTKLGLYGKVPLQSNNLSNV